MTSQCKSLLIHSKFFCYITSQKICLQLVSALKFRPVCLQDMSLLFCEVLAFDFLLKLLEIGNIKSSYSKLKPFIVSVSTSSFFTNFTGLQIRNFSESMMFPLYIVCMYSSRPCVIVGHCCKNVVHPLPHG